jgi:hypothetical protein
MTTINIGCGSDTWGDIRVDYTRKPKKYYLQGEESSANLIADAQYLPFINKCFSELKASHVLEHIKDWKKALAEWCRVSNKVSIIFPTNSNSAVITLKCFFQNWDLSRIKHLLPNNLKTLVKLREQCTEHLWQFDVNRITSILLSHGFVHVNVRRIDMPLLQFRLPFSKLWFRTTKLTIPHSWCVEAW